MRDEQHSTGPPSTGQHSTGQHSTGPPGTGPDPAAGQRAEPATRGSTDVEHQTSVDAARWQAKLLRRRQRHARRYSRFVRIAKWLMPVAAIAVLASIFLTGHERGGVEALLSAEEAARLGAGLRLDRPRLAGVTKGGEPFVVVADAALPDGPMPDEIALEAPQGRLMLSDGRTLSAVAESGVARRGAQTLTLDGGVTISTSDGYRFETDTLTLDMGAKGAATDVPVLGTHPRGRIEAGSMRITSPTGALGAATVLFEGGVRVLFTPPRSD
ncbi:MAG: LPS export ABC transporter periplasmic protein LptC [Pseudomonadota bacterium]